MEMFTCYNSDQNECNAQEHTGEQQDGDNGVISAGASLIKIKLQMKNAVCGCSVITAHFQ